MSDWSWPTFLTSSLTAAVVTGVLNYTFNKRNLQAKFSDRIYDLNKLMLNYPAAFATFWAQAMRQDDDYFKNASLNQSPASSDTFQHRAIAYYYLNLFEEMFFAHRLPTGNHSEAPNWQAWKRYMFGRLRHPLIRETFLTASGIKRVGSELELSTAGHFSEEFATFLYDNRAEWQTGNADSSAP